MSIPQHVGNFTPIGFINNAGHVMVIWIPSLVLSIYHAKNLTHRVLLAVILLTLTYILMLCAIRSTIIALLISELMLFCMIVYKDKKQALIFLSISALLLSGAALFTYSDTLQNGRLSEKLSSLHSSLSTSYQPRLNLLVNSKDMLMDNPLGVGVNNFEFVHPKYAKIGTKFASPMVGHSDILKTPHNIIAKLYTELGWLGGTLLTLTLLYYLFHAWRAAWFGGMTERWVCMAYNALLINAQFSAVFLTPVSLAFSVLLIAAIHSNTHCTVWYAIKLRSGIWRFAKVASLLSIVSISGALFMSEVLGKDGMMTLNTTQLKRAVMLNPGNERAWLMLSIAYRIRDSDQLRSLTALQQFRALNPENIHGRYKEALIYKELGRYAEALNQLTEILKLHSNDEKTRALCKQVIRALPQANNIADLTNSLKPCR
ncbi:O-antigen ligase family protein [Pseudoalteromonas rubra]|nr:O-antigen ligase family protein [Pseudoalteromonas rubra]